jgi:homocysteine S-methyltransferase
MPETFSNSMLSTFINEQGFLIIDGGLATELERRGYDLRDPLWSAKLLLENPEAIRQLHADYLWAGADCIISASYQATLPGFIARGLKEDEAERLIRLAVQLAREARDQFWSEYRRKYPAKRRRRPLVAASVGPYGAYLADGAEYTGKYDLTLDELTAWHRPRWRMLADCGADLLACETIPARDEAAALAILLAETDHPAWISFSCRDGAHISDGTPLTAVVPLLADLPNLLAIGANCTAPRFIPDIIKNIQQVTAKPIIVYPNSGERYNPQGGGWEGEADPSAFGTMCREWRKTGAALIGGCCRTSPAHIQQIRDRVQQRRL